MTSSAGISADCGGNVHKLATMLRCMTVPRDRLISVTAVSYCQMFVSGMCAFAKRKCLHLLNSTQRTFTFLTDD